MDEEITKKISASVLAAFQDAAVLHNIVQALLPTLIPLIIKEVVAAVTQEIENGNFKVQAVQDSNQAGKYTKLEQDFNRKTDELEQYQRRENIRIFGIPEIRGENTDHLVLSVFNKKVGEGGLELGMHERDISRSHRIGPPPTLDKLCPPRPIIVRLASYRQRDMIFRNKRFLRGTDIVIREDLTATRRQVLNEAIVKMGKKNVWTQDGIIIWKRNNRIESATTLAGLRSKLGECLAPPADRVSPRVNHPPVAETGPNNSALHR